jgi:hypothetical protein
MSQHRFRRPRLVASRRSPRAAPPGFFSSLRSGFVAARLAASRPLAHGVGLGALAFVLGAGYQVVRLVAKIGPQGGAEPPWYLLALPAIALVGCSIGGWMEERRRAGETR